MSHSAQISGNPGITTPQTQPSSFVQSEAHPSPLIVLPSSQDSFEALTPSPQRETQAVGFVELFW